MPPHRHDVSNISLVLSGTIGEDSRHGTIAAGPACVVFKPAGSEHGNRVGSAGAVVFALRLDPRWRNAASLIGTYLWCSQDWIARVMLRLYAFARATADTPLATVEQSITAWLGALTEQTYPTPIDSVPSWMTGLQHRLHLQTDQTTRIGDLASTFGMHPVYVARVFRRCLGSSPTAYARRVRIAQAAHRLATTKTPLAVIAAELGFADQAHFSRCFREHVGLAPGGYRRLSRPV